MRLVDAVASRIDDRCRVTKCNKAGCTVSLRGTPPERLVLDFDKPGSPLSRDATRCDYLVVAAGAGEPSWVATLELQSGTAKGKVIAQLQAGTDAAGRVIPARAQVVFRPVVVARAFHRELMRQFRRTKVRFHDVSEHVSRIRCGACIADAFRQ